MHLQAIQLFGHVDLLGQQHDFLLDAGRIQLHLGLGQAVGELLALPFDDLRQVHPHLLHFHLDAIQTLLDQCLEVGPFAGAGGEEIFHGQIETAEQFGGDRVHVLLGGGHDPRPAQHVHRVELALARFFHYPVGAVDDEFGQLFIDMELAGGGLRCLEPQVALHLAALQLGTETLTQDRLQAAQLLRQADVGFQIALVDRTNFPNGCAPVALEFLAGVGGHAVNH
ncbi:hypothetical protein D3C71_831480 [compost metagenome]